MSRLAARAEVIKLGAVLGRDPEQLRFLEQVPAVELRALRTALDESLFHRQQPARRRVAAILRWLPRRLSAFLMRHVIGARLVARLVGELPARTLLAITAYLPESFVAESVRYADPRRVHDALQQVPPALALRVQREMLSRGDYLSLGRFVEFLPDERVRALEPLVEDDAALVEIAFFMESKNRVEHFLRLLPPERVSRVLMILGDPARRALWPKVLLLLTHAGPALQKPLTERIVALGEPAMNALVHAVHEEGLFADMLPVALAVSEETQRLMANLDALREPGLADSIVRAADEQELWPSQLRMMRWMDGEHRALIAAALENRPAQTLERLVHAAVQDDLWEPVLDLVARQSPPRQQAFADILRRMGAVDPELFRQVAGQAQRYGLPL